MKPPVTLLAILLVGAGAAACGAGAQDPSPIQVPDTRMTQAELAATGNVATELVGTWTGTLVIDQSIGGVASSSTVTTSVELDGHALPTRLPALGFVGSWQTYDAPGPGSGVVDRLSAGSKGDVYVFCAAEADGDANPMTLDPVHALATASSFAWRYQASYRFADLLAYQGYGYDAPGAPTVTMNAVDSYEREGDTLVVAGHATGTDSLGRAITFDARGELHQGAPPTLPACRLR